MKSSQKTILDNLWSLNVKSIEKCEKCGSTYNLSPHHFIKRRYLGLRWVVENGFCLCQEHHNWAELNTEEFSKWAIEKRGQDWFDRLMVIKQIVKPILDYKEIRQKLKEMDK